MAAANYDIKADQGSTFIFNVSYLDSSESVVDLTDYSAPMQVRKSMFTPLRAEQLVLDPIPEASIFQSMRLP